MQKLKIILTDILICVALALLVQAIITEPAHAVDIETAIGVSQYKDRGDGYWLQEGFPNTLHLQRPAASVGLTGDVLGIAYHADWNYLGNVHTVALATSDANYNLINKGCNGPCQKLQDFTGAGHDQGVSLTLQPFVEFEGYRIGGEFGPYIHKSVWAEYVPDWLAYDGAAPQPITVHNYNRWVVDRVMGVSISRGRYFVNYRYFQNQDRGGDTTGAIWSSTHVVSVGYRF